MDDPAISIETVVRRFGDLTAVDQVSLGVDRGEVFGLLGHNGAGKTTLIRLITGLLRPDGGSIRTLGHDPVTEGVRVRESTGVLTEYPALDHFLSPVENLEVYAAIHGLDRRTSASRRDDLLERLGLTEHRDVPSHSLSAGLKQRVALARALIHDPQLLLLDEPTSNLDPIAARDVRNLVLELAREQGRTVLLSTHNLAEAQELCDRVAILRNGRVVAVGRQDQLTPMGTGLVSIRIGDGQARQAAAILDGALSRSDSDERTIHVRASETEVPALVARLVVGGIEIHSVVPDVPTLEDVYLSFHDHRDPRFRAFEVTT